MSHGGGGPGFEVWLLQLAMETQASYLTPLFLSFLIYVSYRVVQKSEWGLVLG